MKNKKTTLIIGNFTWDAESKKMERIQKENHPKVGEGITITPKQLRLLQCLYRAHPEVLQRKEIVDFVWESKPTSPESLPQLINRTRITLEDIDKNILVNEPGVGYSLNFSVSPCETLGSSVKVQDTALPSNEIDATEKGRKRLSVANLTLLFLLGITAMHVWSATEAFCYAYEFKKIFKATPYPDTKPIDSNHIFIVIDNNECIYSKDKQVLKCP